MATALFAPSEDELAQAAQQARQAHPELGIAKLLSQLKLDRPEWAISEKRLRKTFQAASSDTGPSSTVTGENNLETETGLDASIDIAAMAPKVKAKMLAGRGKGLVARDKMPQGEWIWQEEPWCMVTHPDDQKQLENGQMCSTCLAPFLSGSSSVLRVTCTKCQKATFCNKACYNRRREAAAHHELLCEGSNPACRPLWHAIKIQKLRYLHCVARLVALWRGKREWGDSGEAKAIEQRVWKGMARVNMREREMALREWEFLGDQWSNEWAEQHRLLLAAIHPSTEDPNHVKFQKLMQSQAKGNRVEPLTQEEERRWFSFDSFLQLLGLAAVNMEDNGGLYALHAHLNHSCQPNISVRRLPRGVKKPPLEALPCELPPPLSAFNPSIAIPDRKVTMIARRTIHPGDELTITYVNPETPRDERRAWLREKYGFWCYCSRCETEKNAEPGVNSAQ